MFGKSKTPTVTVQVKQDPIDYTVKRKVQFSSDGKKTFVTMEKPTKQNPAGWELNIGGKIRQNEKGFYVEAIRGQKEALQLDIPQSKFIGHEWTTDEITNFANMNIFKARYGKLLGDLIAAIKPYLIVLAVVTIIAIAVSGYNAYVLSKIPQQVYEIIPKITPAPTPPLVG